MEKITEKDCFECGMCCYFPNQAGSEIAENLIVGDDDWCIHYDDEKKCTIHKTRPQICRDFKFGVENCLYVRRMIGPLNKKKNNSK